MFNKCGGSVPRLEKLQMNQSPYNQNTNPYLEPMSPSMPAMPSVPGSGAPATPFPAPAYPNQNVMNPQTGMPNLVTPAPSVPSTTPATTPGVSPDVPNILPEQNPGSNNPFLPEVFPNTPSFLVPSNPLLPPGYQEVLDYDSLQFMNGFLRTQIGREVEVEFLVGSSSMLTRSGQLIGVGINYILLYDRSNNDIITCDFYNIKFVRFYY